MYDEKFGRMWEFYLISAEMMFRTGSQLVFHMQLARKRDAVPIIRDYITDVQRKYTKLETENPPRPPEAEFQHRITGELMSLIGYKRKSGPCAGTSA